MAWKKGFEKKRICSPLFHLKKYFGTSFESLNKRKRKALLISFKAYLREMPEIPTSYRFDLVEVDLPSASTSKVKVFHHENIAIFHESLH